MEQVSKKIKLQIESDNILFFDLDGTLVDTDYANFLSYKQAIESVIKSNFNIEYNFKQRFNRSLLKDLMPNLTETELKMIVAEKEKCYEDFLPKTKLNKEVVKVLCKYFKTNKTVLVTNCREDRAHAILNYHGLTGRFSDLFFRQFDDDSYKINKFQNAISHLRVSPELVIAFENEEAEITDARKAGIKFINLQI